MSGEGQIDSAGALSKGAPSRLSPIAYCLLPIASDLAAIAVLVLAVLASFRDSIGAGLVVAEKDTRLFFYPLQAWFAEEFKSGRFPLWNPYIFAGYPMFSDGEIGLAYPLHLVLLHLLPVDQAFIWLRVSSLVVAALSMYALCRSLGLGQLPSLLGGLTFSLGSFFLNQQHHDNVIRTAAWLPLVLACTEWALHRAGWRRHAFLTGAGAALAMAALGLHPQVLGMTLIVFFTFVIFRVGLGPVGGRGQGTGDGGWDANAHPRPPTPNPQPPIRDPRPLLARLGLMVWVIGYVGGIGLGLAAVQLLPLAELGAATYRGSQPDYRFATSYALPVHNLANLLFPYFFRGPDATYWSLWAKWETTLYVGIGPLLLGILGAVLAGRRCALYFIGVAFLGLWLAIADYAPFDLYAALWQLPGFSAFRVPGRYTYLFVFAWAVLAALGLQALQDAQREGRPWRRVTAAAVIGGLAVGGVGLALTMANLRSSLALDPAGSIAWIQQAYLSLRHHEEGLSAPEVYRGLLHSLDPATPRTAFALVMLTFALLLAAAAAFLRRSAGWWRVGLAGLAAVDLLAFETSLHQKVPVDQLSRSTAAIQFLTEATGKRQQAREGSNPQPPAPNPQQWRVFTAGSVPSLEFDRLVPFRLEEIGGYSSAEPRRNYAYWAVISSVQNGLVDLANVRYLVYPARRPALPSYRLVPFDPERPLMLGARAAVGGRESYTVGGLTAHRLQVIAALTRALEIPQGAVVAEIRVVPRRGDPVLVRLRAGEHVAEWAYDRPDVRGKVKHGQPQEIAFRRPDVYLLDGTPYHLYLYYSEHDLPAEMDVERIAISYVHPLGGIELYGLGLYNFDTGETAAVTQQMRSNLKLVYRDGEVVVMENLAAFPRAYVVPRARKVPGEETSLWAMLERPFDPTTEVMLEGPGDRGQGTGDRGWDVNADPRLPTPNPQAPTPAQALSAGTDRVVYRAWAPEGGYLVHVASFFPGWRAWVDGQEAPILPANGLFRAVPLPAGEHLVELRYEPPMVEMGRVLGVWTALVGLLTIGASFAAGWLRQRNP